MPEIEIETALEAIRSTARRPRRSWPERENIDDKRNRDTEWLDASNNREIHELTIRQITILSNGYRYFRAILNGKPCCGWRHPSPNAAFRCGSQHKPEPTSVTFTVKPPEPEKPKHRGQEMDMDKGGFFDQ
jgi:hypothetical protein